MTNIHIIIPVTDTSVQDFSNLVNELCGNYEAKDHIEITINENGEEVQDIKENPYKNSPAPNFFGKITLVSCEPVPTPDGVENIVIDGELNIAKLWNYGISHAANSGATHIVILNEVSSISPYVFEESILEHDAPVINLSDGGCFIVTPGVNANESYRWWFADVDLFERNYTVICRKEFLDIIQDNRMPIQGEIQSIVNLDIATRFQ